MDYAEPHAPLSFEGNTMGFWDKAWDISKKVVAEVTDQAQETNENYKKLKGASDNELLKIVHTSSLSAKYDQKAKTVARSMLKARGYDDEKIRQNKA